MALSSSFENQETFFSTSNFIKDRFADHLLNENQENFSIHIDRSIKDRRKIQINKALAEIDRKVESQCNRYKKKDVHELKLACKHTNKIKRGVILKQNNNNIDRENTYRENFQSLDKLALKLSQKKTSREEKIKAIYNIQYQIDSLERSIHI